MAHTRAAPPQTASNAQTWTIWESLGGQFASVHPLPSFPSARAHGQHTPAAPGSAAHKHAHAPAPARAPAGPSRDCAQAPRAILNSEGFLHLFAKATDEGTLMHKFQFAGENGTCWSEWASLGGALTSMPNVLLDAEARPPPRRDPLARRARGRAACAGARAAGQALLHASS
jgi:hypothetical protein